MFVNRSMITPFVDAVVHKLLGDVELFEALELAMQQIIKAEANIDPPDDVADTEEWMIRPCAAILSKLVQPKIDAIQEPIIARIERDYAEALKTLRAHRIVPSTVASAYGTMEGGVEW